MDRQEIFAIYTYALFTGIISLTLPLGIQAIISLISGGQVSTSWVVLVIIVLLGILISGILQILQLSISENMQQKIFARSAFEFAYRIPRMNIEALDNAYTPEIVNRFFDTLTVQKGLSKILLDFSSASLQVLFGLLLLCLYHPFFILFSLTMLVVVYLIFRLTAPAGLRTSINESKYKYEVAYWLEELARTNETFKLAGESPLPIKKTDQAVGKYLMARKAHFKTLVIQYINLLAFKTTIAAGLLIIGSLLVIEGKMNIGQFVASEIIIILVLTSIEKLILSMETIYDVLTAVEKIGDVTDIPIESDTGVKPTSKDSTCLSINISNLSYRFNESTKNTLDDLTFEVKKGEKVCLSGHNGAGKSVLLQIIAGLYNQFNGAISYDGIPLKNWHIRKLRSLIGDSLAKEDIFNGSIHENISLGKNNVPFEEVKKVADLMGLNDFIESLPLGFNTVLISEGKSLPKSVRLKIMLARCLAGSPKLILLEDNFNWLNKEEKHLFLQYLLHTSSTVIAVSNDPKIAQLFDKILVLKQGKLLGQGPYEKIINESWYSEIFQTL